MDKAKTKPALPLRQRAIDAAAYLCGGALIRLFWIFESTLDVRAWGMEHIRLPPDGEAGGRPLLVFWHGKGFVPINYFHGERLCLYASHSRDPNYGKLPQALRWFTLRLIERMGYKVLDASQFASEARGVLRFTQTLRDDRGGAIAADGPNGPIYEAKPGATFLAKKAGVTLLPVGVAIGSGVRLNQWDFFEIPYLFSRAVLVVAPPIRVASDASDEERENTTKELENALNRATRQAEARLRHQDGASQVQKAEQPGGGGG